MQMEELIGGLENEELLIIKDYMAKNNKKTAEEVLGAIQEKNNGGLIDSIIIARNLGFENFDNFEEVAVYPKGYRILNKVPKVPSNIVENLVRYFKSFQHILLAEIDELDKVEGIGSVRAKTIKQSLKRMQEQFAFDNVML